MTDPDPSPAAPGSAPPPPRPNPYVGPRAFRYGETLYGRSREIAELRDVLIARRLVLLYSPSGAGKSSLIEAGLRAELASGGFQLYPTIRVGTEPPVELDGVPARNRYVLSTLLSLEEGRPPGARAPLGELTAMTIGDYLDGLFSEDGDAGAGADPCLVFDQFEELFTLDPTDVAAKRDFLDELGVALRNKGRWALFAMREDFIAQLDPYLGLLPTRLASRYRLDLLDPAAAKVAAQRPAAEHGVAFSGDAADRLVDDLRRVRVQRGAVASDELGPHVEPVQLQVVCRQLWTTLGPEADAIEVEDVAALGNVDDALADFYVDEISAVAARTGVSEREIRTWFDEQLITPDGFRTQVLEGPGAAGQAVVRELENAHLIRADRRRGTEWYELSHDRLVPPVRASNARWREEHLNPLQREAQLWDARSRPSGLLMTGTVLVEAQEWATAHDRELLPVDREYLEACRAEERRRDLERKVGRRNRVLAVVAAAVAVSALGSMVWVNQLRAAAARDRDRAENELELRRRAEDAKAAVDRSNAWLASAAKADEPRPQLLAWQAAYAAHPTGATADLVRKLTSAEHYLAHDPLYLARARALDPTGTTIARGTDDGRIELVDVDTLQRQLLVDVDAPVEAVAFGPTASTVGVAAGGSVAVWEDGAETAELTAPELGEGFGVTDLTLASGGDGLVAAVVSDTADGFFGRLVVWDGGQQVPPPGGSGLRVARAVLSGSRIAVIAEDISSQALPHVWERTGSGWSELALDNGQGTSAPPVMQPFAALTFSADGALLAVGGSAGPQVLSLVGPGRAPPSQPTNARFDVTTVVGAAFSSASSLLTIEPTGRVVSWQLGETGDWQSTDGPTLIPSFQVQTSADGGRALLGDRTTFTVFDTSTGAQLLGPLAFDRGSTSGGRSVVVGRTGSLAEQPGPGEPWRRRTGEGATVDAALSASGQLLARLVEPVGTVTISSAGGPESQQPTCPGVTTLAQAGTSGADGSDPSVAVADNGVAVVVADLPSLADGPTAPSAWCLLRAGPPGGPPPEPDENLSIEGQLLEAVTTSASGEWFVLGTDLNGVGTADLVEASSGYPETTESMTRPVTAVAVTSGDEPLVAAGDDQGDLLVFEAGGAIVADGVEAGGPNRRCDVPLPTNEEVVSVAIGADAPGGPLVAAATRASVFVYRVSLGSDPCATLTGGFDLLRDEGEVLDLAFSPDAATGAELSVLESDRNVFTFDAGAGAEAVADRVADHVARRGWVLTDEECQAIAAPSPCPPPTTPTP